MRRPARFSASSCRASCAGLRKLTSSSSASCLRRKRAAWRCRCCTIRTRYRPRRSRRSRASLEILRPPDAPALLLIASYRSEDAETSPFLRILLPRLLRGTSETHELVVGELSPAEARRLAMSLLHDPDEISPAQVEAITRESRDFTPTGCAGAAADRELPQ